MSGKTSGSTYVISLLGIAVIGVSLFLSIAKSRQDTRPPPESIHNRDQFIRSQMETCFRNQGSNHCYRDVAQNLITHFSLEEILASFTENEAYPEIFSRCHEVTHYLGRAEYMRVKSIPEVYGKCTPACHGGCYHGVMEGYFKEKNLPLDGANSGMLKQEISTICGRAKDYVKPRLYTECLHGIGHALMFITDADLPKSLELCNALDSVSEQKEACYGGVFMENSSSSTNTDHPSKYIDKNNLLYPCTILNTSYLKLCYQYQSSYFAEITHGDWEKTIALCNKVPVAYRDGCFLIIGTNQVGFTQDLVKMKNTCALGSDPLFHAQCVRGVINSLGGRYPDDLLRMHAFCALTDVANQKDCYTVMGSILQTWERDPEKQKSICDQIPDTRYRQWCIDGTAFHLHQGVTQ